MDDEECCQYPVLPVPISSTNARISNAYRKLVIGNIGNGNTSILSTLAIRSNPVGDAKKGEAASCLFQRDKSGVGGEGCTGERQGDVPEGGNLTFRFFTVEVALP